MPAAVYVCCKSILLKHKNALLKSVTN